MKDFKQFITEEKEIKVGDWVRVRKVGIDGIYEVESIDGEDIKKMIEESENE